MADQFGEKSHEATPHRRQQARREGQVAKSQDLTSAVLLLVGLLLLLFFGNSIVDFFGHLTQEQLGGQAWVRADRDFAVEKWQAVSVRLAKVLLPLFGLLFVVAVLANVVQVGFLFLPKKLALDIGRISPLKGFGRMFSIGNAARLGFGIFKIVVIAAVAVWSLWAKREQILTLGNLEVPQIAAFIVETTIWTCLKIGIALLVLAIADYAFQRWKHERDLRMTTQELREEMKTLQGDPQIIARRRAVQRQLITNRLSTAVPEADVIVTNPTEVAIAIKYDLDSMDTPIVVSKGTGVLAQRIRRLGLENTVPIIERKELAQFLYKAVDINQPIPTAQYAAVAEVLRYVYELNCAPAAKRNSASSSR